MRWDWSMTVLMVLHACLLMMPVCLLIHEGGKILMQDYVEQAYSAPQLAKGHRFPMVSS